MPIYRGQETPPTTGRNDRGTISQIESADGVNERIRFFLATSFGFRYNNTVKIKYSDKATKQISTIAENDRKAAGRILKKIEQYAAKPTRKHDIKALKGKFGTFLRLRAGEYRIIFELAEKEMLIYEIKH